jgi:hypothetical protein
LTDQKTQAVPRLETADPRAIQVQPEPLALPPNELTRVTEHVIGELDRRVLSYRERMGKI